MTFNKGQKRASFSCLNKNRLLSVARMLGLMAVLVSSLFRPAFAASDEDSLSMNRFTAKAPVAQVLWIPSEYGLLPQEKKLAKQLQQKNISVLMPDLFDSYFLPAAPSSMKKIPPEVVANLIVKLQYDHPNLPLFIIAPNQAAALAVKALVKVEQSPVKNVGLILLNPNLYVKTPEAGKNAEYWPSVLLLNLPIMVLQSELSPWHWHLAALSQRLSHAGSDVFIKVIPKVRDRYYFRPDAMDIEQQTAKHLANELAGAMGLLSSYLAEPRQAGKSDDSTTQLTTEKQTQERDESTPPNDDVLPAYTGVQNRSLVLQDRAGKTVNLKDYRGKVVLLNFWASWCPPCVHEMPSMATLKNRLKGQDFEILAANLAEDKAAIDAFVKTHPVNFPILLDPKGSAVKEWKVFAYPSSYLIDKKGQIRFALFGGYEWTSPAAMKAIENLLKE
ncbi:TlpA disulfide reductase family protein [Hydrogenovibrio kuenenii]|uniref:TlpA disulfide reductase family protein n=1 Tax=Hydrogenovibrio kuenenii TaxID=63658 RepID=UPI000464B9D3|nr:TlpA disulfide reductase family protein [Hydrogenovibrio kuenenii]